MILRWCERSAVAPIPFVLVRVNSWLPVATAPPATGAGISCPRCDAPAVAETPRTRLTCHFGPPMGRFSRHPIWSGISNLRRGRSAMCGGMHGAKAREVRQVQYGEGVRTGPPQPPTSGSDVPEAKAPGAAARRTPRRINAMTVPNGTSRAPAWSDDGYIAVVASQVALSERELSIKASRMFDCGVTTRLIHAALWLGLLSCSLCRIAAGAAEPLISTQRQPNCRWSVC